MILVVASNAPPYDQNGADYIYNCTGIDDQEQIEAAMNLASQGGPIHLSVGDFYLSAPLEYVAKPIQLIGRSTAGVPTANMATRLHFDFDAEADCVLFAEADPPTNAHIPQALMSCAIIGDGVNTRYGVRLRNHDAFKTVREVAIAGVTSAGVRGDSGNSQNVLERVLTWDLSYGFYMYGVTNRYMDCQAQRSVLGGYAGFEFHDSAALASGCFAERYEVGFSVREYANAVTLIGCDAEGCTTDLNIWGAEPNVPKSTHVVGGFRSGICQIKEGNEVHLA
jgi:hypothetical protein